jgi:hypothetical protein
VTDAASARREPTRNGDTTFAGFIRRSRAGDEQAARELVERYEPVIRREVKMRLRDPRLYRRLDWTDICNRSWPASSSGRRRGRTSWVSRTSCCGCWW